MIELGGQKVTATGDTLTIPYDTAAFARKVGAGKRINIYAMPKDATDPLPLALTFPDGKHFAGQAQLEARTVGEMIRGAIHQTGPISFGAAGDDGGGRRGLILIDDKIDDVARGFGKLEASTTSI